MEITEPDLELGSSRPSQVSLGIFFIVTTLSVGALVKEICKKLPIPYPAAIFIMGISMGANISSIQLDLVRESFEVLAELDATALMNMLVPAIIFYSGIKIQLQKAFTCDIYILKTQLLQIVMLSMPSLLVSAGLIALCLKFVFFYDDEYYSWGFAITFGAIVSCTDPMEVVKLLENAGAPKKFISLVQGESLFNNGSSMILLLLAVKVARGSYGEISDVVKYGVTLIFGGILLGFAFGVLTVYWVKYVNTDNALTINVTIVSAYLTYFLAEYVDWGMDTNGLVAVMALGIFMSAFTRQRIRSDSEHSLEIFWQYVTFAVESMIFLITGIIVGFQIIDQKSAYIRSEDYSNLPLLYLCILGSRLISIIVVMKGISHWGFGMKWSEMIVFTYSGCRGSLQLTLAMLVTQEKSFSNSFSAIILFHTAGIVILSMLINGSTTGLLVKLLGMSRTQSGKQKVTVNFLQEMKEQIDIRLTAMKDESMDKKVDWDKVRLFSGIEDITKEIEKRQKEIETKTLQEEKLKLKIQENSIESKFYKHLVNVTDNDGASVDQMDDLDEEQVSEARDRFLMALKQTYWDLFSQNQCSGKALSLLIESVRRDQDTVQQRMCSWDFIYSLFYQPLYMRFLYWMKGFPLFGKYAGNVLFDWVGMGYEVMSTYIKAHEEMDSMITEFPLNAEIIQMITKESLENRTNAERFVRGYLYVSFPEIIRLIQTKRAALTILVTEKKYCDQKSTFGELEAQEYQKMRLQLNYLVGEVEDLQPSWSSIAPYKKLKNIALFKEFSEKLLQELCRDCMELVFDKDQCITREGELARYIYVVFRGRAIESCQSTCQNYTQVREIGSLISPHHIMLKASIYITQCIAEAMVEVVAIPIEIMIKLVNKSHYMQEYMWKESLYAISRFYFQTMKPMGLLESLTIQSLTQFMVFTKFKKDSIVQFHGGILLYGKIETRCFSPSMVVNIINIQKKLHPQLSTVYDSQDSHYSIPAVTIESNFTYTGPHAFPPRQDCYKFVAITQVDIYVSEAKHSDEIREVYQNELSAERPNKSKYQPDRTPQSMLNRKSFGFSYLRRAGRQNTDLHNDSHHINLLNQRSQEFTNSPQPHTEQVDHD